MTAEISVRFRREAVIEQTQTLIGAPPNSTPSTSPLVRDGFGSFPAVPARRRRGRSTSISGPTPKPTLTKGEVEGVELGGAPISVCVCSMTASRRIRTFLPLPGAGGSTPKPNLTAGVCAKDNLLLGSDL